jgi:peroxiredoxin
MIPFGQIRLHLRDIVVKVQSVLIAWIFIICACLPSFAEASNLETGTVLSKITLNFQADESAREYLGLKNQKTCSLTDIPCKLIILEILSLYCPICHKQAPVMKSICKYIQQDQELSKNVKVIGIGAGNNMKEVGAFKEHFKMHFPVFADHDFSIHKKLGEPRTPATIVINSRGKVLYVHSGQIEEPDRFKQVLRELYDKQ